MPSKSPKTTLLIAVTVLSLIAQGMVFAPAKFRFIFQRLPDWGNLTFGIPLFFIAFIASILIAQPHKHGSYVPWMLFVIQAITVIGIYFLQDGFASRAREAAFLLTGAITVLTISCILANPQPVMEQVTAYPETTNKTEETPEEIPDEPVIYTESNSSVLKKQVEAVLRKFTTEKYRTTQLTFLNELSRELESELDPPVAAQLAINMLEQAVECSLIALMMYDQNAKELTTLASAGKNSNILPPGYRQDSEKGVLGRTVRLKKTQLVNDTSLDTDFFAIKNENTLSEIAVPVLQNGQLKGIINLCSEKTHAFGKNDVEIVEGVALELTLAWERSSYNQRLKELIQAGISLTTLLDPHAAIREIANLARKTLDAHFVFITLMDQRGNYSRTACAGEAPKLFNTLNLNPAKEPLLQAALNAIKPFRIRDIRKYTDAKNIEIDHSGLRSALAIPIRLHGLSIGTIVAFGRQNGVFFSENDESLAGLLASQAAASIESSWLYQELRNTLNMTSLLYQLSLDVTQIEDLHKAAELIAGVAHKATNARESGIVLLPKNDKFEIEVEVGQDDPHTQHHHPMEIIHQAIQTGQCIFIHEESSTLVCYPLITRARTLGALWMDIIESGGENFANIQTMANQAAVTLERAILLAESRRQAMELQAAYQELQATYDQTLTALMSALDARDRETEGHSLRVSHVACLLGEKLGLNDHQLKTLERGSLLHDIGKIGISDAILHKPGKLTEDEWKIMRTHPEIGSGIVESIPFLQECMPVVRYHHERWDGSGYPLGIKGEDIPLNARIFAVADVFDALTSKRSYRKSSSPDEAVAYLHEQAGILFDPAIVQALAELPYHDYIEAEKTLP